MDKERFSLLLLEPNEIYFEDFLVNLIDADPTESNTQFDSSYGRLKMCSKSIVFDPRDKQEPIIKIVYKDCDQIYQWDGNLNTRETNVLAVSCTQYTEMLDKNILAPYKFVAIKRLFLFNLHYGRVEMYLNQLCQLHRASSLHAFEQNDMIATIVYSRYNRLKFDPLWLNDIYERVVADFTVEEINPLIMNPGRLLLSSSGIYFQPYNNIQPYPVKKISLKSLTNLSKRRYLLRHTSLEIKWTDNGGNSSNTLTENTLYVSFRNVAERDEFYDKAMEQDELCITHTEPESMTLKWQNGVISNYEYLLYLNSLADRTFQDLTQYPIFPWIISDYTSPELNLNDPLCYRDLTKPIGALNAERLLRLKERCEEMGEPKFLYGSHYSAPGLVLFYLVRKHPNLMLCLQNGRFDHPDRMFNRVEDAFRNCLNNMSDFKELIPEFYDTTQGGDFLLNKHKINFGSKHNGATVNHVILPPWAYGSTDKFISKLREALESDYVSQNLNHWIDLIFGYKQRGDEALKANNLFYYLCYEGSVDLDQINDLAARHALEVQISEFGQIPKQLFDKPHVPKAATAAARTVGNDGNPTESGANNSSLDVNLSGFSVYDVIQSHKDVISCVTIDNNNVFSTGKDGLLKCYNIPEKRQLRSVSIGSLPLSCCVKIPKVNALVLASWDNTIMTYNLDYGRVVNEIPAHDDAVSCLSLLDEMGILVSGSWDCSVKVWKGYDSTVSNTTSFRLSDLMLAYLPLEEKVASVQATRFDQNTIRIVIGTFGGDVWLWSLRILEATGIEVEPSEQRLLIKHTDEITAVSFNSSATKVASSSLDGVLHVCDIATGMTLFRKQHAHPLTCLSWRFSDEMLLLGDEVGMLTVWNMQTGTVELHEEVLKNSGIVSSIAAAVDDKRYVIVAGVESGGREFSIVILNCLQS